MTTHKITHEILDYWFDKTIDKYVPNTRQKAEIESELRVGAPKYIFISDMKVLFHGAWGSNNNHTFCSIQIKSTFEFTTDNIKSPVVTESVWLLTKHQYQLAINIFRQNHWGKFTLPCNIDVNLINEETYKKMREQYGSYLWFDDNPPIGKSFNAYW